MLKAKALKPKRCKAKKCGEYFTPRNGFQKVCSPRCSSQYVQEQKAEKEAKRARSELKEARDRIKTRSDWLKEAQAVCNKYIRLRDAGKPCISCGKPDDGSHQRHASHYRPTGNCSRLRFHEDNIHASCMKCNAWLSGNLTDYRIALARKLGSGMVAWLEAQNEPYRWEVDDAKEIKKYYTEKSKALINPM